jgi:DNA (cytosine-5)-methyltransferase 1
MKFISLFAGIGGFDLGLERAGMTCVAQVEKDDWCRKVLTKHWPDVPRWEDIYDVRGTELPAADLICGGFPCQPFSLAGKRQGKRDDRHLWPEYLRLIKEVRPRWVIGENVFGIINMALDGVLSDLENAGYIAETLIIPAVSVDAPHRRDRVWIVAHCVNAGLERYAGDGKGVDKPGWDKKKADGPTSASSLRKALAHAEKHAKRTGLRKAQQEGQRRRRFGDGCQWLPEPSVGRVASRVPRRVDRLRGLGNAVVPQVVEQLGRMILEIDRKCR